MNYTQAGVDHRTNEEIARVIEEMIRTDVYPVLGITLAITPYIIVSRGGRQGSVVLSYAQDEDKPDTIQVAAKLDKHSPDRIFAAIAEHAIERGFVEKDALLARALGLGFSLRLNRDDSGLRYFVTRKRDVEGSAVRYEALMLQIAGTVSFIGKATNVNVYYGSEQTKQEKAANKPFKVRIDTVENLRKDISALFTELDSTKLAVVADELLTARNAQREIAQALAPVESN